MDQVSSLAIYRDLLPTNKNDNIKNVDSNSNGSLITLQIPPAISSNPIVNRLCLLPAYPTFDRFGPINRDHLLLTNVSRQDLTNEQRKCRDHHQFYQPFTLIDQSNDISVRAFFVDIYHRLYGDLTRRLKLDDAILDYNYERLRNCINIMTDERIRYGLLVKDTIGIEEFRIAEYPLAMEFYLQIDYDVFFMKTCSFRNAQPSKYNHHGIFCINPPEALYGITACRHLTCRFCFPITDIIIGARQEQPVIEFSAVQRHRFFNGYETFLNCPASCTTKNILYALTCPCKQYDYIGYTSMSLAQALTKHREHGNRIIHEFILGLENTQRMRHQPKSQEELIADEMLLYKHSTHCPSAVQLFLDCNSQYWYFIPMVKNEARTQNIDCNLPMDCNQLDALSSFFIANLHTHREQDAITYINNLPAMPSQNYAFSGYQYKKQFQIFKDKHDELIPNYHLDLYNATIIAVLPDQCSDLFYQLIESLFITHAQTKLNTLGHLDGMIVENNNSNDIKARIKTNNRGDWCQNLVRRPSMVLRETRKITSHRVNPHFQ